MRQTLFYIPSEIFGVPVFGFGLAFFLLAIVVIVAVGWRYSRTKKLDEEIWSYLGVLFFGALILLFVAPNVMEPRGFPIRGYGVCLLVAILSALALVLRLTKEKNISSDLIFSLCLWAVVSGILGARIFYVTEYHQEMIVYDAAGRLALGPTVYSFLNIANGGLVVYGSIFGGIIGSLVFMIRNKMPVLTTFDCMAPAMMLGLAIGRIGCFLNGCCYGGVTDFCCGIVFPEGSPAHLHQIEHGQTFFYGLLFEEKEFNGRSHLAVKTVQPNSEAEKAGITTGQFLRGITGMVQNKPISREVHTPMEAVRLIEAFQHENPGGLLRFDFYEGETKTETKPYFVGPSPPVVRPVHPTQIYSSIADAVLCLVLLGLGRMNFFRFRAGLIFAAFMMLYAPLRFCIEIIRTDEASFLGTGFTVAQNICFGVFLTGFLLAAFVLLTQKPFSRSAQTSGDSLL